MVIGRARKQKEKQDKHKAEQKAHIEQMKEVNTKNTSKKSWFERFFFLY